MYSSKYPGVTHQGNITEKVVNPCWLWRILPEDQREGKNLVIGAAGAKALKWGTGEMRKSDSDVYLCGGENGGVYVSREQSWRSWLPFKDALTSFSIWGAIKRFQVEVNNHCVTEDHLGSRKERIDCRSGTGKAGKWVRGTLNCSGRKQWNTELGQ